MKLGEIKIEALKIMFAKYNDNLSLENLSEAERDENYNGYLVSMPGSINRCFSEIEQRRVVPLKSHELNSFDGTISGNFRRYNLSEIIPDLRFIERIVFESGREYNPDIGFDMEGDILVLPNYGDGVVLRVVYYPKIDRITSETSDETDLSIPDYIACLIPYYIKGDLFREDEPNEASEARNWFEAGINMLMESSQGNYKSTVSRFSLPEV